MYAGARDPSKATELQELLQKCLGRIVVVKCVSADAVVNAELAKVSKEKHGRVDTIIANAGASDTRPQAQPRYWDKAFKASVGVSDTILKTDDIMTMGHTSSCPRPPRPWLPSPARACSVTIGIFIK